MYFKGQKENHIKLDLINKAGKKAGVFEANLILQNLPKHAQMTTGINTDSGIIVKKNLIFFFSIFEFFSIFSFLNKIIGWNSIITNTSSSKRLDSSKKFSNIGNSKTSKKR